MNSFARRAALLALTGLLTSGVVSVSQAQPLFGNGVNSNPTNSPIRRANPNSRQGTVPSTPPVRGPSTAPNVRPPTLENGGIGNGYPTRQQAPRTGGDSSRQGRQTTD
jgi:hypothetical protein